MTGNNVLLCTPQVAAILETSNENLTLALDSKGLIKFAPRTNFLFDPQRSLRVGSGGEGKLLVTTNQRFLT